VSDQLFAFRHASAPVSQLALSASTLTTRAPREWKRDDRCLLFPVWSSVVVSGWLIADGCFSCFYFTRAKTAATLSIDAPDGCSLKNPGAHADNSEDTSAKESW